MSKGKIIIGILPNGEYTDYEGHLHHKDIRRAIEILQELEKSETDFEEDCEGCLECKRLS